MEPVQNLSILTMVLHADLVVKVVMGLLVLASVWSWSVAIDKWFLFSEIETRTREFEKKFWSSRSLPDVDDREGERSGGAMARVYAVGAREWQDAERIMTNVTHVQMAQERVDRLMASATQREIARAGRGLGILATIGSATPFIGLFGTVWGIMNAFRGLSNVQQATLAAVAPGIAEALVATAIGLFAAIPAVVAYNRFARDIDRVAIKLETFIEEFSNILQRNAGAQPPTDR